MTTFLISSCVVNKTLQVKLLPFNTSAKNLGIVNYVNVSVDTSSASEKEIAENLGVSYFKVLSFQHIQPKTKNDTFDSKTTFFIGRISDSIIIVPDANNNNSLEDDKAIIIHNEILQSQSLKDLTRLPLVDLQNLQTLYQGRKYTFSRKYFLLPDSIRTGQLHLTLISNEQVKGMFKYKGKKFFVTARLNSPYKIIADSLTKINIRISDVKFTSKFEYNEKEILHLYDTLRINRDNIIIRSVSPDLSSISIELLSRAKASLSSKSEDIRRFKTETPKKDFSNQQYSHLKVLADKTNLLLNGKVIFLNFWFADCVPCIAEFNSLNHLNEKFKEDTTFKLISLTFESPIVVEKFKEKYNLLFDIYSFPADTISRLNLTPFFPTNIIIDRKGIINEYYVGGQTDPKLAFDFFKKVITPYIEKMLNPK